jgi:predicted lipoprotein with Yx(FWY)xxD motif
MSRVERPVRRYARWPAVLAAALSLCIVSTAAMAAVGKTVTVTTHQTSRGKVLAAANGHSLYMFSGDKGGKSSCNGTCASAWPPVRTGAHAAAARGSGVNSTLLGTTRRSDGTLQVTYNKHPLYLFPKDKMPGQITGENASGYGGHFDLVNTAGNAVKPKSGGGGCPPGFKPSSSGCVPQTY